MLKNKKKRKENPSSDSIFKNYVKNCEIVHDPYLKVDVTLL
jgi:hypothetical protein